mmetsp:Transcript_16277/g.19878  ORF Transcript_16277/g.19878 Transcript_16277/m.19878 type:complete len:408 (-) Transcript_16277:23-1246(-)
MNINKITNTFQITILVKMEKHEQIKQLKNLLSRDPIDWKYFLRLDIELSIISSPSLQCSFPWIIAKYPPKNVIQELLSRYHHYLSSNEDSFKKCLVAALNHSSTEAIRFLAFQKNQEMAEPLDDSLNIPLHRAGTTEIAHILLQAYPAGVTVQNRDGNLPLHIAIMHYKTPDHIKLLFEEGKKRHLGGLNNGHGGILIRNKNGQTPFSTLCRQVATGIDIAYLTFPLFRSDLRLWENLNTLLQAYATRDDEDIGDHKMYGHFKILHSIISSRCPFQAVYMAQIIEPGQIREADETGRYPLSLAASQDSCRREILLKLLEASPQAIYMVDSHGRYPLHWAASSGRKFCEGTQELYDAEPTVAQIADGDGMVPFMLAASSQHKDSSVDSIYRLLRQCPETLIQYLQCKD